MAAEITAGQSTANLTPLAASRAAMPTRIAVPGQRSERKHNDSPNATRKAIGTAQDSWAFTKVTMLSTKSVTDMDGPSEAELSGNECGRRAPSTWDWRPVERHIKPA